MKHKRIEEGIADWRATGSMPVVPYWLALKAEVLHLADRKIACYLNSQFVSYFK
jgi:hypothetical protein